MSGHAQAAELSGQELTNERYNEAATLCVTDSLPSTSKVNISTKNFHHLNNSTHSEQKRKENINQPSCLRTGWADIASLTALNETDNFERVCSELRKADNDAQLIELPKFSGGRIAEELPAEQQEAYKKDFPGTLGKIFRIKPCGTIVTEAYKYFDEDIYNFKFRPDDVLVMTYPKCGTTWTQEIIWNMRNNPNLDHPNPHEPLFARSPFLDLDFLMYEVMQKVPFDTFIAEGMLASFKARCPTLHPKKGLSIQVAESQTEPRTLKTHLAFSSFKPGLIDTCKVVFVMRHPKDAVLSYQHHSRLIKSHGFVSTQDVFVKYFVEDLLMSGSYGNIVNEAMKVKSHPNMHLMYYEDMKADIGAELRRLNDFLGTKLTAKQLKNVEEQTSFNNMQKNDPLTTQSANMINEDVAKKDGGFIRNGLTGVWKGKMTQQQEEMMDKYIAQSFHDPEFKARYQ
ncbi:Sulfotransferase domain [Trinorchestia longiramus]|nr:Sulfotransferase domain [Trinorchestia longiramus]